MEIDGNLTIGAETLSLIGSGLSTTDTVAGETGMLAVVNANPNASRLDSGALRVVNGNVSWAGNVTTAITNTVISVDDGDSLNLSGILAVNIAKMVGLVLGTAFRFWAYRTFVFSSPAIATHIPAPAAEEASILAAVAVTGQLSSEDEFEELTHDLEAELAAKQPATR